MGDSLYNFDDLSYTGLTDTANSFTGSSTVQDVQLGSPLMLDTQYLDGPMGPVSNVATPDFLSADPSNIDFFSTGAQSLTGASETPPSAWSMGMSTPTPNTSPGSDSGWAALNMLSKMGASLSGLMGGQPRTVAGQPSRSLTTAGAPLPPATMSGSMVLVMVIVAGALILLLARGD